MGLTAVREPSEVYDVMGQLDRLTARQIRLTMIAEAGIRPVELSEWEAFILIRHAEFACWLDEQELQRRGVVGIGRN